MPEPLTEAVYDAHFDKALPKHIFLQPRCNVDERCWCEDDPGMCNEHGCGLPSVKYIRYDLAVAGGYNQWQNSDPPFFVADTDIDGLVDSVGDKQQIGVYRLVETKTVECVVEVSKKRAIK